MPDYSPNLNIPLPRSNEAVNRLATFNAAMEAIDENAGKSSDLAAHLAENAQDAHGGVNAGSGNKDTQEVKTFLVETDTRSVEVTRTSGQISSLLVKDPSDNSTVASMAVNRVSGQVSSIMATVGAKTITTTINRTSGQVTSITKAVS